MAFAEKALDQTGSQGNLAPEEIQPVREIPPPGNVTLASQSTYRATAEVVRRYSVRRRSPSSEETVDVTVLESVEDLLKRTDLQPGGQAAYRSAMLWLLSELGDQSKENRLAYAKLLAWQPARTGSGLPPASAGARGARRIPETDYRLLIEELAEVAVGSDWASRTLAWVQATLACGARPIEWLDIYWKDPAQTALMIVTAKEKLDQPRFLTRRRDGSAPPAPAAAEGTAPAATLETGDANTGTGEGAGAAGAGEPLRVEGDLREVPITRAFDRMVIRDHLLGLERHLAQAGAETTEARLAAFKQYHNNCRTLLRRVVVRLWKGKKSYTLYTMRSQFQANHRAAVLDPAEVRRLMGHTTDVSGAHYGRASQAFARFKPEKASTHQESSGTKEAEEGGNRQIEAL
jgi:hypothetical protein